MQVCEYKSPGAALLVPQPHRFDLTLALGHSLTGNIVGFDATGTAKSFGDNVLAALS